MDENNYSNKFIRANAYFCDNCDETTPSGYFKLELIYENEKIENVYFQNRNTLNWYLHKNCIKIVENSSAGLKTIISQYDIGNGNLINVKFTNYSENECLKKVYLFIDKKKNEKTEKRNKYIIQKLQEFEKSIFSDFEILKV